MCACFYILLYPLSFKYILYWFVPVAENIYLNFNSFILLYLESFRSYKFISNSLYNVILFSKSCIVQNWLNKYFIRPSFKLFKGLQLNACILPRVNQTFKQLFCVVKNIFNNTPPKVV